VSYAGTARSLCTKEEKEGGGGDRDVRPIRALRKIKKKKKKIRNVSLAHMSTGKIANSEKIAARHGQARLGKREKRKKPTLIGCEKEKRKKRGAALSPRHAKVGISKG